MPYASDIQGATPGASYYYGSPQYAQTQYDAYVQSQLLNKQYEEDQKQREWEAAQAQAGWENYLGLVQPLLSQVGGLLGGGYNYTFDPNDPAILALTNSIARRGDQSQAVLASRMARAGTLRSGPNAAAAALLGAETQGQIAGAEAQYASLGADRAERLYEAQLNALIQALGALTPGSVPTGGLPASSGGSSGSFLS